MVIEDLRTKNWLCFSGHFDQVEFKQDSKIIVIEKVRNGKYSWIYFIVALLLTGLVFLFSSSLFVRIAALIILVSLVFFIFTEFKTILDLENKKLMVQKKSFFLKKSKTIAFADIIDWILRSGEMGYLVKAKTGNTENFIERITKEITICRISDYQEASLLTLYLKEILLLEKPQ